MANYLTVQEAAEATGKSVRTIRRLCYEETSKDYITYDEKNRLLVDANFLAQNYPLTTVPNSGKPTQNDNSQSIAITKDMTIDTEKPQEIESLALKVALLQQELKLKEEHHYQISKEKDKRIESLERTLLMLGEGVRKEPAITEPTPVAQAPASVTPVLPSTEPTTTEQPEPELTKKKWWKIF